MYAFYLIEEWDLDQPKDRKKLKSFWKKEAEGRLKERKEKECEAGE
jgi:hypothetical protein